MAGNASQNPDGSINPLKAVATAPLAAAKSVVDIGGQAATGAGDALIKMISPFIPQSVKGAYGDATQQALTDIKSAWDAPATTPSEQKGRDQVHAILSSILNTAKNNPETIKTVGNAISMVLAPSAIEGGIEGAAKVGSFASKGADAVSGAVDSATTAVKNAVRGTKAVSDDAGSLINESGKVNPDSARASAWNDIQPKGTPTTKLAYAKAGNTTEQGLLTKGKITPSSADSKLLDSYQNLYEDGTVNDKMTPQEKQAAVQQKSAQLHGQQKDFLTTHDKAVTLSDSKGKSGLFDQLDATAKKSSMPFSKDASAKGAYDSAIDTFKAQLDTGKSAGTVSGASTLSKIDSALTNFDAQMDKFGAWGKTKTGEMTDTAMARQQAIRDIHTEVRDYIASQLPKNSPWTAIRSEESNMYQISDRLAQRSADTVGSSKIGQAIKNNPVIKAGVNAAAGATGVGAAIKLIP